MLRVTDPPKAMLLKPAVLLGSMGLIGFAPIARGTAASIVCCAAALGLHLLRGETAVLWFPLAAVSAVASLLAGDRVLKTVPEVKDPGWFVLDEAAGFFLTLALLRADSLLDIFAGLLTFRFYDIAKPWPVRNFERLPGSLGILADDLAASVFAAWTWCVVVVVWSVLF